MVGAKLSAIMAFVNFIPLLIAVKLIEGVCAGGNRLRLYGFNGK
jgi:hypothetical protein